MIKDFISLFTQYPITYGSILTHELIIVFLESMLWSYIGSTVHSGYAKTFPKCVCSEFTGIALQMCNIKAHRVVSDYFGTVLPWLTSGIHCSTSTVVPVSRSMLIAPSAGISKMSVVCTHRKKSREERRRLMSDD